MLGTGITKPEMSKDERVFRVKFKHPITGEWVFGTIVESGTQALRAIRDGMCLIADAITPAQYRIPHDEVLDIPLSHSATWCVTGFGIVGDDEFSRHVFEDYLKHRRQEQALPDDKQLHVGHIFYLETDKGVAFYIVRDIIGISCRVEWRGWKGSSYDPSLGYGGRLSIGTTYALVSKCRELDEKEI